MLRASEHRLSAPLTSSYCSLHRQRLQVTALCTIFASLNEQFREFLKVISTIRYFQLLLLESKLYDKGNREIRLLLFGSHFEIVLHLVKPTEAQFRFPFTHCHPQYSVPQCLFLLKISC